MTKWARIENNQVMETITLNPTGRFPNFMVWVSCSDEVKERWTYDPDTKTFTEDVLPQPTPTPELPTERLEEGYKEFPPPTELPTE